MLQALHNNYSRHFDSQEVRLQREIAAERRKITERERRQALIGNWIGNREGSAF